MNQALQNLRADLDSNQSIKLFWKKYIFYQQLLSGTLEEFNQATFILGAFTGLYFNILRLITSFLN